MRVAALFLYMAHAAINIVRELNVNTEAEQSAGFAGTSQLTAPPCCYTMRALTKTIVSP